MKKIGIDARLYFQTGVGTYLRNLLHYLPKFLPRSMQIFVYVLSKDIERINISESNIVIRGVDAPWHSVREQTLYYQKIMTDELDLMHFTYFSYPVLYKRPFIATIHDVTPLLYKTGKASTLNPFIYETKYAIFKYVLASQVKNAKWIITPTEWVKKQIVQSYGKKYADKIQSIHEGVNYELMESTENISLKNKFTKSFFLYVGNFYPHKNVERLIEAFKIYYHSEVEKRQKNKVQLVLIGPDNMFAQKLKQKIEDNKIENVRFIHDSTIKDLVFFYKHAQALINPSLSEGFGLPLVEAIYFECPIIASDIPVFHEILKDQYISFNPENIENIADKLKIKFTNLRTNRKSININFIQKYNFEKMSRKTVSLYSTLI